jgi:hypothetical protein
LVFQLLNYPITQLLNCCAKYGSVLLVLLAAATASAQTTLDSTILLQENGGALILEHYDSATILWPFQRRIPVQFASVLGNRVLRVEVLEATDGAGRPLVFHTRHAGDWLVIDVASGAERELQLVYLVRNAVQFFPDHDEFYWPVNPPGMALALANLRVRAPVALTGRFAAQVTLRRADTSIPAAAQWSSDGRVPFRFVEDELRAVTPGPLAPGITLVVDVFADKDGFTPPSPLQRAWWYADSNRVILLPLLTLGLMLILRRWRGADVALNRSVAPMYGPPEGLTPAECGTLMSGSVEACDITATLVDLAARGYIRIEGAAPQPGMPLDRRDFIFRLLKPKEQWQDLAPHEHTMLFHTFYGGQWTMLSSLRLRFPEIVPLMREQIMLSLRQKGMYRIDPTQARLLRQGGLLAVAGGLLLLQQLMGIEVFTSPWLAALMLALSAAIMFLLDRKLSGRTARGTKAYIALLGLQEFINTVDADRINQEAFGQKDPQEVVGQKEPLDVPHSTFLQLLPYAMALGIEHKLAHAFEGIAIPAPNWFVWAEDEPFEPTLFGHKMNLLTVAAQMVAAAGRR